MKRKLLRDFADWLEKSRRPFNLGDPGRCIAPAVRRFLERKHPGIAAKVVQHGYTGTLRLSKVFDMTYDQAREVYAPQCVEDYDKVTRKVAAATLRRLANTGRVVYKVS